MVAVTGRAVTTHHDYVCTCEDGEQMCDPCFEIEDREMRAYFGIRPGMPIPQGMDPRPVTPEQMDEWRKLK